MGRARLAHLAAVADQVDMDRIERRRIAQGGQPVVGFVGAHALRD